VSGNVLEWVARERKFIKKVRGLSVGRNQGIYKQKICALYPFRTLIEGLADDITMDSGERSY